MDTRRSLRRSGFSLIEVLVVVGIMSMLGAILLPSLSRARCQAKIARWGVFTHNIRADEGIVALYTFEFDGGSSTRLKNVAVGGTLNSESESEELDGMLINTSLSKVGRCGKDAAYFNGANAYANCQQSAALDVGTQMSVLAWVYPLGPTGRDGQEGIINNHDSNADTGFTFYLDDMRLAMSFGDGGGGWPYSRIPKSQATVPLNRWSHVAVVRDGTTMTFYLNGKQDSVHAVGPNKMAPGQNDVWIGGDTNVPGHAWFSGYIDEIAVYNRALDKQAINHFVKMGQME